MPPTRHALNPAPATNHTCHPPLKRHPHLGHDTSIADRSCSSLSKITARFQELGSNQCSSPLSQVRLMIFA
ncbi:hypothetical protein HanRHA438_Chr11g0493341 [Helianthus annuus]|uniref:Uncharacterized protein n=1 Tax=Helianthus annuus TaxID=4232 RepID=A0A251T995_HELAN|nr:hypothetical protein HanHA300_Chr11g0393631 [Helianthus annuus]KAJ0516687.1 hypothetical protein HanHA89_Chr11g0416611 [Helianthus annuus]KAJ0684689.1 hypothetical protein HanLR1_Chr11g0393991 [Helianthus annuus]KAJ0869822.1 hypothetical protein HanRHA438_Chr11g0493341 [Helianthus annuus]